MAFSMDVPSIIPALADTLPTPFWLYEERLIRQQCRELRSAFEKNFVFSPLFAVKANSNPAVLKIIQEEGFGFDCASQSEAWIISQLGGQISYTGNYQTREDFEFLLQLGAETTVTIDTWSDLERLNEIGMPKKLGVRINPGSWRSTKSGGFLMGGDTSKFGVAEADVVSIFEKMKSLGVESFGLHIMMEANVLDPEHFVRLGKFLIKIIQLLATIAIPIDFMNIGGGFGVVYNPNEEKPLDVKLISETLLSQFTQLPTIPRLLAEPGRFITANSGFLVTRVQSIKEGNVKYVGVDAGMNDLIRPGLYGAYHHITVISKRTSSDSEKVNIVGRMCENTDQLAKGRELPKLDLGDLLVLHTVGAHGFVQSYHYTGRPKAGEYLLKEDGTVICIRRAETIQDLFRLCPDEQKTLSF